MSSSSSLSADSATHETYATVLAAVLQSCGFQHVVFSFFCNVAGLICLFTKVAVSCTDRFLTNVHHQCHLPSLMASVTFSASMER